MCVEFNLEIVGEVLKITLSAESDENDLIDIMVEKSDISILYEGTESYWVNGSFEPFDGDDANPFIGLTGAPCVAEIMYVNDDGQKEIEGDCWYYPGYMVDSFLQEILDNGFVYFRKM